MNDDTYSIEDGNDPLKYLLDVDINKMSSDELKTYLNSLNEATENPKAVKRILTSTKSRKKTTTSSPKVASNVADLLKGLGI